MKRLTPNEARAELTRRGFRYNYTNPHYDNNVAREYWVRTDGKPDVLLDHSATITHCGGRSGSLISDFITKENPQ